MTRIASTLVLALLAAGCASSQGADGTTGGSPNRTAIGAGAGAVVGGLLGNRIDQGDRVVGTAVGAAVGAAAGAGIGRLFDRQEEEFNRELAAERAANEIEVERVREDLLKLTLDSEVSFDFNSAAIKPSFKESLTKLSNVLKKYDRNQVTVVGHTDSVGSEAYNQELSVRRAQSVVDELAVLGVPRGDMRATGRGELEPRATNESEAGRQLNRRVEILVQPQTA